MGFKAVKSLGWQWQKTRRTDPARISRHWFVLSVATLLTLAYGTRVEDAYDRRLPPAACERRPGRWRPLTAVAGSSREKPGEAGRSREKPGRIVSVIRYGIAWLRRLLHRGRFWSRVWLLPERWPEP